MTFLSVLLTLLIERVAPHYRPNRDHRWFNSYCRRLAHSPATQWLMNRPWGPLVALLPPLMLLAWLQHLSHELGVFLAVPFSVLVLLYSLGPGDLGTDTEAFLNARDSDDSGQAGTCAQRLCLSEVPAAEPRRSMAVARAVVVLANRRLIGPIFWFVVFGAVGAAAYRAVHLLAERLQRETCPQRMQEHSDRLRHIADWAPARITAAGYAVAGNFDAVAHAWRSFDYAPGAGPLAEAEQLLAHTGLAALDTFPEQQDELGGETGSALHTALIPPVVEDALALVWRTLAIWVATLGGGSLVAALT